MSETVTVRCVGCNAKLRIKSRKADGKKITCPKCEHQFVVQLSPEAAVVTSAVEPLQRTDAGQQPMTQSATGQTAAATSAAAVDVSQTSAAVSDEAANDLLASSTDRPQDADGTLVSWEEGIGDDKKFHIAHITPVAITHVLKLKDYEQFTHAVASAKATPKDAETILMQLPKAGQITADELAKATYAEKLSQLTLFDIAGQKVKVPEGKEQADFFAAIKQHLGGAESEEEADAWSVMQSPLFILAVIAVIGGFLIWFTSICDPAYEASGRRSGMKQMMNWVGYKIGPLWMSVAVGSLAALVLAMMIVNLVKRPIRQVLEFS